MKALSSPGWAKKARSEPSKFKHINPMAKTVQTMARAGKPASGSFSSYTALSSARLSGALGGLVGLPNP